jgi:uncharacterized protein (TIGR02300 family)
MSLKAARGTKRVCQSCGSKFYDLNRDPITCPICQAVFQQQEVRGGKAAVPAGNTQDDDEDDIVAPAPGVDVISLDEASAEEENDLPDLDGDDIEIEDDDTKDDETFIEVEDDDDGGDVTGIVGSREDDDEV